MAEKKEEKKRTDKVQIEYNKSMLVNDLDYRLSGVGAGQQKIPGSLEKFSGKFGYYLSLCEGAIERPVKAVNRELRTPDKKFDKYVQKFREINDRYAQRDDKGQSIPNSLADPEAFYQAKEKLEKAYEDVIEAEEERQRKSRLALEDETITIEINHKLRIDNDVEYLEDLFELSKEEIRVLQPFFDGDFMSLDFSEVKKKKEKTKQQEDEIKKLKHESEDKSAQIKELKEKLEKVDKK